MTGENFNIINDKYGTARVVEFNELQMTPENAHSQKLVKLQCCNLIRHSE